MVAEDSTPLSLTPSERELIEQIAGRWTKRVRNGRAGSARTDMMAALIEAFALARRTSADKDRLADDVAFHLSIMTVHSDQMRIRTDGRDVVRSALDRITPA